MGIYKNNNIVFDRMNVLINCIQPIMVIFWTLNDIIDEDIFDSKDASIRLVEGPVLVKGIPRWIIGFNVGLLLKGKLN